MPVPKAVPRSKTEPAASGHAHSFNREDRRHRYIVLINPRFVASYRGMNLRASHADAKSVLPVINLPLLAALTPVGHNVTLIDENVEEVDFERCARADIVGITGMSVQRSA